MVFALVASFLWIVTVLYTIGYMRGLGEHAQTRFSACFALALFGAIGCAFADNLFTLYLFYEIVSITTYPLVAHHQDREGYEGGRKYLVYLTGTAKGLVLPAIILTYVMCGTLDSGHIRTGIFERRPSDGNHHLCLPDSRFCQERCDALSPLAAREWWRPLPVSALLHAVAVVKVGVFSTRSDAVPFGVDTMRVLSTWVPRPGSYSFTIRWRPRGTEQGQPEGTSGILHRQSALLHNPRRSTAYPGRYRGGLASIVSATPCQDHPVFLCRAIYVASSKKDISEMKLGRPCR
jgi:multicomponent Na+:H+ antiporter subunit D